VRGGTIAASNLSIQKKGEGKKKLFFKIDYSKQFKVEIAAS
jgi:hypothetical protein